MDARQITPSKIRNFAILAVIASMGLAVTAEGRERIPEQRQPAVVEETSRPQTRIDAAAAKPEEKVLVRRVQDALAPYADVKVDTLDRAVILTGKVTTFGDKRDVLRRAGGVEGVVMVMDHLTVGR